MAAIFGTYGPIDLYLKPRINGSLHASFLYLGTCEVSPEVEIDRRYNPVFNDLGGRKVQTVDVYDGEVHQLSLTVNRLDHLVWNLLKSPGNAPNLTTATGETIARGVVFTGYNDFQFLMVNTYSGGTGDPSGTIPPGRLYYSTKLLNARETGQGTRVNTVSLLLEALPLLNTGTRAFALFTEQAAAWGTVTAN